MPFTFSHPALVLPFFKVRSASISMSSLIIGSITPDFEYFIKMKLSGRHGHSLEGMFLPDLPIAILIALLFHQVVKKSLIDNLPSYFSSRLISLKEFDFPLFLKKHFLGFLVCLLIGTASHIGWDSFTHANSFFVDRFIFLSTPITIDGLSTFPLFRTFQHLSTIVGAGVICFVFHRLPVQQHANTASVKFWITFLGSSVMTFMLRAFSGFEYFGDIVTTIISAGLIGLIIASISTRMTHD